MPSSTNTARTIHESVEGAVAPASRLVLAVSGGRDSMVLLDAVAKCRHRAVAAVATFDHGTGASAREAAELVRKTGESHGFEVTLGRASQAASTEAAWREARWSFLMDAANQYRAQVATAHTRDDQIETVLIRALRGAGPRGLAGLFAQTGIVRPLLGVSRAEITGYAATNRVRYVDDPTNVSRRYLRNRVRLDILPACEAASSGFGEALLGIARRSAEWRRTVEAYVQGLGARCEGQSVFVDVKPLTEHSADERAFLWPVLAAQAGIALDRRGTERLAGFSRPDGRPGRVQLSGGHEVVRRARSFEIRRAQT